MDYAGWVFRASSFLRSLTGLPGTIDVDDSIEEPGRDSHAQDWLASPGCSVPPEVKAFLQNASRRCCLSYWWKPPEPFKAQIGALWPGREELAGGGDLCELARYRVYDSRAWFRDAGIPREASPDDLLREQGLIPILILQNDGCLSLKMSAQTEHPPVVYTSMGNGGKQHRISASFEEFLTDWERLCYITPNPETLAPWLSAEGIRLDTGREATDRLQALFASAQQTNQNSNGRDP
jgi:hypothetical protein